MDEKSEQVNEEQVKVQAAEKTAGRNKDLWSTVFLVIFVVGFGSIGRTASGLFHWNSLLTAVIAGAIGGLAGTGVNALAARSKTWVKVVILVLSVVVVLGAAALCGFLGSDDHVAKQKWQKYAYGTMHFEYPLDMVEIKDMEQMDGITMKLYNSGEDSRLVMYMRADYEKDDCPDIYDSLEGAILNALNSMKADNVEWFDVEPYDIALATKLTYTINGKTHTGFGMEYREDKHMELFVMLPCTQDFSDLYFNRVINGIQLVGDVSADTLNLDAQSDGTEYQP